MTDRRQAMVPVSIGEYFDRLTILELKVERSASAARRTAARSALDTWQEAYDPPTDLDVIELIDRLRLVNGSLWESEDAIRSVMDHGDRDRIAVVAEAIVRLNDRRAEIKGEIDRLTGSAWADAKNYAAGSCDPATPSR